MQLLGIFIFFVEYVIYIADNRTSSPFCLALKRVREQRNAPQKGHGSVREPERALAEALDGTPKVDWTA